MIEINVEIPQREVIESTVTINAKPEITGVTASVDNSVGTPYVDVTPTGTGIDYSFDLAFHNLKGDTGETGNGIASIAKTSTSGLVDTYTITYDNGNATTFNVTNGEAATVNVGSVETGAAGTDASVTNVGTENAAILDFVIPQGIQGEQGIQGVSVTGVSLISTLGLQKTYRMTFSNNTYFDYVVTDGAAGATTWGGISGVLANQTDLQNALNDKYNASNPNGYITGINSTDVTTALGYTPYDSSNPNGYTSNIGTVTSVNNESPDSNGNVTLVIPDTATWGNITGTLSDQTDLNTALGDKLNYNQITNCLLEIPQDIKIELNSSNVPVLKAGSKVYVPNGFEEDGTTPKFDTVNIANDTTLTDTWSTANSKMFLFYKSDGTITRMTIERCDSGSTLPTTTNLHFWYDTTNNVIKSVNSGSVLETGFSLPLAIFTAVGDNTSAAVSVDRTFNGFGYIGAVIFSLPNTKGLIPNGRNDDGTLNNTLLVTDKVQTITVSSSPTSYHIRLKKDWFNANDIYYDAENNLNHRASDDAVSDMFTVGSYTVDSGKVNSLTIDDLFRGNYEIESYRNGSSWYRVYPRDNTGYRWCEQGGIIAQLADTWTITFLKPFANGDYNLQGEQWNTDATANLGILTQNATNATGNHAGSANTKFSWRACGYIN